MPEKPVELMQGTLELLILKTLSRGKPMHGFNILQWIYQTTEEALTIEEGSLYPALHRLERRKMIRAKWATSERGRRAKYYRLTAAGRRQLAAQEDHWTRYVAAVGKIFDSAEAVP